MTDAPPPLPSPPSRHVRLVLLALGWLCVGLGIAGIILPLMPGTVFLIVAAACFARSSPRFEAWLVGHPRFGPPILEWRRHGAIPPRIKLIAIGSMTISGVVIWTSRAPLYVAIGVSAVLVAVSVFIATRPTAPGVTPL
jgi:uncharacterized membrane protein YbaN (DUF454 family)